MLARIDIAPPGLKIFEQDPDVTVVSDAFYIPRVTEYHDPHYGLFNQYGRLVEPGAYFRGTHSNLVESKRVTHFDPLLSYQRADPDQTYIYAGDFGLHFGHFLTGTLSRFWCEPSFYRGARIVLHSGHSVEKLLAYGWFSFFMQALGIAPEQLVIFDRPTIIGRLHIPSPAFGEDHYAHRVYHDLARRLAAPYRGRATFSDRVYLSKTRLTWGVWYYHAEQVIEDAMRRDGFEILHPEDLPLPAQLDLFRPERIVLGITGSAFHNSVFASGARGIALSSGSQYSSNFHLMDAVSDACIDYYHTPCLSEGVSVPPGFHAATRIVDPEAVADELISLSREVSSAPRVYRRPSETTGVPCRVHSHDHKVLAVDRRNGMLIGVATEDARFAACPASRQGDLLVVRHPEKGFALGSLDDPAQAEKLVFEIVPARDTLVHLRDVASGRFLSCEPSGKVARDRAWTYDWEMFALES